MSEPTPENQKVLVRTLIKEIALLLQVLPTTVRRGHHRDKIPQVLNTAEGESIWQTFNKRFDALCAEDTRDGEGQLPHIRRGPNGMDLVVEYLQGLTPEELDEMPSDLVIIKLD